MDAVTPPVEEIERPIKTYGFRPGISGNPAGRPKGAKNAIDVRERCEELGCDPFCVLAMIANADYVGLMVDKAAISLQSRLKAATELASYLAPKLKSIEIDTGDQQRRGVVLVTLPASGRESHQLIEESNVLQLSPDDMRNNILNPLGTELSDICEEDE